MNKYLNIIFLLFLHLLSCTPSPPTEPSQPQETTTTTNTPVIPIDTTSTTISTDMVAVTFTNNSSYTVNVFVNAHRDIGGEVLTTVEAGQSKIVNMYPSQMSSGDAFYFEYILSIGDIEFPYFSYERSKVSVITSQSNNNVIIDELTSCETQSSYLVLENISSSPMHLLMSSSVLTPETRQSDWIECGGVGVFRMGSRNEPVNIRSTEMLKVSWGTKTLDLQKPKQDYQPGNIYTFAVNNDTPILRTVTPFNIDIQRQIWQVTCENRQKYSDCIVQSRSVRGGTVIFGEAASNKLYSMVLDQYGAKHTECEIPLAGLAENGKEIVYCYVYDGLENSDGTIVLITKIIYADENESNDTILLCYNPSSKSFRWVYAFAECVGNDEVLVRMNCQNTIIRRSDNVYAIGCAVVDSDSGRMSPFFAEFDCNDINAISVRSYKSPNISDTSNDESMFTSVYFDETHSEYIAVGFENWDSSYPSDHTYNGVVYRIYTDVSGDWAAEREAAYDNCLLLGIDGDDKGHYYICGETMLIGKVLQGCYLSSEMIAQNETPIACPSVNDYCWYNQISVFDDKIVCCGQTSADFNGTVDAMPIVAAYDYSGNLLWENTSFTGWTSAYSCFPNGIGSYIIELWNNKTNQTAIVSADLLGQNTGELVGRIE